MKKLSNNLILASLIAAVVSGNAMAATGTKDMTSTTVFSTSCSFQGTPTTGALAVGTNGTEVGTDVSGGTPITMNINYFGSPTFALNAMAIASPMTVTQSSVRVTVSSANPGNMTGSWTSSSATGETLTSAVYINGSSDTLTVNQAVKWPELIKAGTYTFTQTATCT